MQLFTIDNNLDIKKWVKDAGLKIKDFKKFTFVCEYYETRNSWGHKGKVIYNGNDFNISDKIRYYNRTWEKYTYQALLRSLVNKAIEFIKEQEVK